MAEVAAIILAAGGSSRFGRPKQLVEFDGISLVQRAIKAASEGGCRAIVVVTGSDSQQIAAKIVQSDVSTVENGDWQEGIASSIRTGVRHLIQTASPVSAVVLMVCDQPFVSGQIVAELIDKWRAADKLIVASNYSNTLGVPALFDRSCFEELLHLQGDTGAKPIILKDPQRVAQIPFPEGHYDIDTEAASARLPRADE